MTYEEKLKLPQWQVKRKEILERDNEKCSNCGYFWTGNAYFAIPLKEFILEYRIQIYDIRNKVVYFNSIPEVEGQSHQFGLIIGNFIKYYPKADVDQFFHGINICLDNSLADLSNFDNLWVAISMSSIDGNTIRKGIITSYIATIFEAEKYPELINCQYKHHTLHIHHKKYIKSKMPWEYQDSDLITLCNLCHQELHKTETIPIFNTQGQRIDNAEICDRCNGSGYLDQYHYVEGGICFKCNGEGVDLSNL